jgi:molybdenum storage protein
MTDRYKASPSEDGRFHVSSSLKQESLVSSKLLSSTGGGSVRAMVPGVIMVAIGGKSIMDASPQVIHGIVDQIVQIRDAGVPVIVGVGGGERARHTFAVGADLGIPPAGLARVSGGAEEQNRDILQFLLAPYGAVTFIKDHFQDLQLFLREGMIPVCIGQPPYHFWEPPPEAGNLPDNGPDVGLLMMAEVIGAERVVLVKDVDGLFSKDPKTCADAQHIKQISVSDLLNRNMLSLPVEKEMVRSFEKMLSVREVNIINGQVPGRLFECVVGSEFVGSTITR